MRLRLLGALLMLVASALAATPAEPPGKDPPKPPPIPKPPDGPPKFDGPPRLDGPPKLDARPPDVAAKARPFGPHKVLLSGHENAIRSIAISPKGNLLAAGSHDGRFQDKNLVGDIRLWDLPSGKERGAIRGHADTVLALAFTPDAKHLVSGTVGRERYSTIGEIKIWDVDSLKEVRTLKGHSDLVYALAVSADGKQIASASYGGTVILWDFETGNMVRTFKGGYTERFMCVAFSPDGAKIAAGSMDKKLRVWDKTTDKPVVEVTLPRGWITSVAFSPDGKTLVSAGADGMIRFWDAAGKPAGEVYQGTDQNAFLAFAKDGRTLVSGAMKLGTEGRVVIWDATTRKPEALAEWNKGILWGLAITPDGRLLATTADNTVRLWELPAAK